MNAPSRPPSRRLSESAEPEQLSESWCHWQLLLQVRISNPVPSVPTRDLRYASVKERQAVVLGTAYRGAAFNVSVTGTPAPTSGTFVVTARGFANSSAISYNANSTQLCAAMTPMLPINGCSSVTLLICTVTAVRVWTANELEMSARLPLLLLRVV